MKTSGSYSSLVQGVSQQVPQNRGPGQMSEQINMIPDPVEGMARRQGSMWQAERNLFLTPDTFEAQSLEAAGYRVMEYNNAGNDFVIMYRYAPSVGTALPLLLGYNRTTKQVLTFARNAVDVELDKVRDGGISAITAVGKYLFFAGNTTVPAVNSNNVWESGANQQETVVWIRGGAYARTFSVTVTKTDNTQVTFSYTTPTSSYQGTLNTSDIPLYAADPAGGTETRAQGATIVADPAHPGYGTAVLQMADWSPTTLTAKFSATLLTNVSPANPANASQYRWDAGSGFVLFHSSTIGDGGYTLNYTHTKVVTNPSYTSEVLARTNAYNSAVTAWIGSAAEAIQPNNIAESLRLAAVAAGLPGATRQASTIIFHNVKGVIVNDGGDNSLIRGVANEVTSIDGVSDIHLIGKVVRVRAARSEESFYLRAESKDPAVTSGYTEVTWVEGAGTIHTLGNTLQYATVVGTTINAASTAALLSVLVPGTHPTYVDSAVGDADSNPVPFFVGKTITYLGVFQDRLVVGAGAVIRCSRIGDYLNFFRSTILTLPASDPMEFLAKGSDDDVLRHGVLYDKDLVIFGDKRQYVVSGRVALTPTSALMATMSSHADAAGSPPVAAGGLIFYGKVDRKSTSLNQIQPGLNPESPDSFLVSSQLNTYLMGKTVELCAISKPSVIAMRTTNARNSIYLFQYLDTQEGRKQDAWYRWDFNPALGTVIGISPSPEGLLVYYLRVAYDTTWLVVDLCPFSSELSSTPYLDSQRGYYAMMDAGSLRVGAGDPWRLAFDDSSEYFLLGGDMADAADILLAYPAATGPVVGADYTSSFTPTSPFVRDRNSQAINSGRLTITKDLITLANSTGMISEVTGKNGVTTVEFNGRVLGDPNNILGREPVTSGQVSVVIGLETRDYSLTLKARKWFPFTVTAIEWVGQFFNNVRRF